MFSGEAAVNSPVRASWIVQATAAGSWMRTDKATRTKEGAASSQPVGGRGGEQMCTGRAINTQLLWSRMHLSRVVLIFCLYVFFLSSLSIYTSELSAVPASGLLVKKNQKMCSPSVEDYGALLWQAVEKSLMASVLLSNCRINWTELKTIKNSNVIEANRADWDCFTWTITTSGSYTLMHVS